MTSQNTIPVTEFPEPGDVYHASVVVTAGRRVLHSADYTHALILDVRHIEAVDETGERAWPASGGEGLQILWQEAHQEGGRWMPHGAPEWSLIDWASTDQSQHGPRLGVEVTAAGRLRLILHRIAGAYKPSDPKVNAVELLRDAAVKQIGVRERHAERVPAGLAEAAEAYRAAEGDVAEAQAVLYAAIRAARGATPRPTARELARVTGLSHQRISQIQSEG